MQCGVSTACFYPQETCEALREVQKIDVPCTEIFLNTFSELQPSYIETLQTQLQKGTVKAVSLHPFTSGMETFFFASMYEARVTDGLQLYAQYFATCKQLGITKAVFHGDYVKTPFPFQKHCENYLRLRELAAKYDVEFCQENVVRCKCGTPDYIEKMREYTKDEVSFVLDTKQAVRAQVSILEMVQAMAGKISHLHLSDATSVSDCGLPGSGETDFITFFKQLKQQKFSGTMVVELYRYGFQKTEDLARACRFVDQSYAQA